jgi:transposase
VKVKGTKTSLLCDKAGLPVSLRFSQANRSDLYACGKLGFNLPENSMLVCDRGYDAEWFRRKCWSRMIKPRIPKRKWKKPKKDKVTRWGRWKVERCFSWLEGFRKLTVRYERLLTHWKAFWALGCSVILMRQLTE